MKKCNKCGIEKPLEAFSKRARSRDGRQSNCKPCMKMRAAEWYEGNREAVIQKSKEYKKDNPEWASSYWRQYHARNRERINAQGRSWYEENRADKLKQNSDWKKANPHRVREYNHRRRAMLAGATREPLPVNYEEQVYAFYGYRCLYPGCTKALDERNPLTIDHVVPLACGGAHALANLQPLCMSHNSQKNRFSSDDFREGEILT